MTRNVTILAAALLVACQGGKDGKDGGSDSGGPTDTHNTTSGCTNVVTDRFPATGDTDVYFKTQVRFTLQTAEADATIDVADGSGAAVPGSTTIEGNVATWIGDVDLAPSTDYVATLNWSCDPDTIAFTTSATGDPADGPSLVGQVYALDLANGEWVQPPAIGDIIAPLLADTQILVSPTDVTDTTIKLLGGIGSAGEQDPCAPTIDFPEADFANPFFQLTADSLPLQVDTVVVTINNVDLSGSFAPDGSRIQGTALAGKIDTRALLSAFPTLGSTDDAGCQLLTNFGISCEDCDDGSGQYCLSVYVDSIQAPLVPGAHLDPVDSPPASCN